MINGNSISEETVCKMEKQGLTGMVNFVRLILNDQVSYYLSLRKTGAPKADDEAYTYRSRIDNLVFGVTHELRPDLWDKYKEVVLEEKVYSSMIPEPAPQKIVDNIEGVRESVGLNTPFAGLKLA